MGMRDTRWDYVPLSEERVVSELICRRCGLDAAFSAKREQGSGFRAGGVSAVAEGVLCVYIDLDR